MASGSSCSPRHVWCDPALASYDEAELANLLSDFDITATYDKANRRLKLGATLTPELVAAQEAKRPPERRPRSRISFIGLF